MRIVWTRNHAPQHARLFRPQVSALGLDRDPASCSYVRIYQMDDDVHCCQACHVLTDRKCSVCGVCVFCSTDCEKRAERMSMARIACAEHKKGTRTPENLGASAIHYVMLPLTPIADHGLGKKQLSEKRSQRMWEILFHGAKHYMHLVIAASPSTLFEKTAFGMSVALIDGYENLCAGFQRLNYPLGTPNKAAAMVIANVANLARAQLSDTHLQQRAVLVVGTTKTDPSPLIHFDAIFVVLDNNKWTIKATKPLWAQTLTYTDNRHYKMHFRPDGHVPAWPLHPLALIEKALTRSQTTPRKTAPLSPLLSAPQVPTPAPPPSPDPHQAPPQPPYPTPYSLPPPHPLSETETDWETHLLRAQAQAEAATEVPPWTQQLLQALPQA